MYSRKTLTCALMLLGCAAVALADNMIVLWQEPNDPNIPPSAYTLDQQYQTITINDPGGYIFRFYAHDGSGTPGTGSIDNITLADPNTATGDFSLQIADPNFPDDPNKPGALHWKAGNLIYAGGTSTILGLHLGGNIATEGDVECESITGTVDIDGNIGALAGTKKFFVQNAVGSIVVHGKLQAYNTLEAETLGDVEICSHPTQGDIKIKNDYAGTLTIYPIMYGGDARSVRRV